MLAVCKSFSDPALSKYGSSNFTKSTSRKVAERKICHPKLNQNLSRAKMTNDQRDLLTRIMKANFEILSKNEKFRVDLNLNDFLYKLQYNIRKRGVKILFDGVRLIGSTASLILLEEDHTDIWQAINDIDICIYLDQPKEENADSFFFYLLQAQEETIQQILKQQFEDEHFTLKQVFEQFFVEMMKVEDESEKWSLLSIGSQFKLDIKFIVETKRKYAFSIDSIEIVLHPYLDQQFRMHHAEEGDMTNLELRDVYYESTYGNAAEALYHLHANIIKTQEPSQIRRGLFRFCLELAKGRHCETEVEFKQLQQEFGKAFFVDFSSTSDDNFQNCLEKFLQKHKRHAAGILTQMYYVINSMDTQESRVSYVMTIALQYLKMQANTLMNLCRSSI